MALSQIDREIEELQNQRDNTMAQVAQIFQEEGAEEDSRNLNEVVEKPPGIDEVEIGHFVLKGS